MLLVCVLYMNATIMCTLSKPNCLWLPVFRIMLSSHTFTVFSISLAMSSSWKMLYIGCWCLKSMNVGYSLHLNTYLLTIKVMLIFKNMFWGIQLTGKKGNFKTHTSILYKRTHKPLLYNVMLWELNCSKIPI